MSVIASDFKIHLPTVKCTVHGRANKYSLQVKLEYYPYDKYKSPHMETPTSNSEGGGGVGILKSNSQSAKTCLNFKFFLGGEGILKSNTQSTKICLNFKLGEGGYSGTKFQNRGVLENLVKNLLCVQKPACASQIVSHILRLWRLIKTNYIDLHSEVNIIFVVYTLAYSDNKISRNTAHRNQYCQNKQ